LLSIGHLIAAVALAGSLGCRGSVTSLVDESPPRFTPSVTALPYSLRVERVATEADESRLDALALRAEVIKSLRAINLFESVVTSRNPSVQTDFVLRGEAAFHWSDSGTQNFLTYFPGGLIFAPGWRGLRWDLRIDSTWALLDNRTGEIVGRYAVDTAHEIVRPSGSPWHFLSNLLIVPGAITASRYARVQQTTKDRTHAVALPSLSRRLVGELTEDRRPEWEADLSRRRDGCGDDFDAPPTADQDWAQFRACQSHAYLRQRQTDAAAADANVYHDSTGRWRVRVRDGVILDVEDREAMQRECGDRLGARPSVGEAWEAFLRCQKRRFAPTGTNDLDTDEPIVFEDAARTWRIRVRDGRIVGWEEIE